MSRRNLVRTLGTSVGVGALSSAFGTAAAQQEVSDKENPEVTHEVVERTDTYVIQRITVDQETFLFRLFTDGRKEGTGQIIKNPSSNQLTSQTSWEDVVVQYNGFMTQLGGDRYYAGINMEFTQNVVFLSKAVVIAAIGGVSSVAATASSAAEFILGSSTALGGFVVGSGKFSSRKVTVGVRDSVIAGFTHHYGVAKQCYCDSIAGTLPVTEPKAGHWHDSFPPV